MAQAIEIKPLNTEVVLQVIGMDCADCAVEVEKALKDLPGVKRTQLSFPHGKLNIEFDGMQNTTNSFIQVINKLGYQAQEAIGPEAYESNQTTFIIGGLDCADCAAQLEKRISLVPGVERAQVNFAASTMVVDNHGSNDAILNAIRSMGYTGKVDRGLQTRFPVSFWKSNKYTVPTIVSLVMLLQGFIFERLTIPPFIMGSSLLVTLNSMRLLRTRKG